MAGASVEAREALHHMTADMAVRLLRPQGASRSRSAHQHRPVRRRVGRRPRHRGDHERCPTWRSASTTSRGFFGKVKAVDDLSLEIPAGTFVTLLGPSGCGKSTTLSLIAGLDRLDEGRILLGDEDITETPPNERRMAMVFQNYALYPHMTAYDNIAFGLKLQHRPKAEVDTPRQGGRRDRSTSATC